VKRFLIGKRVSLHALSEADVADEAPYFRWLDDLSLDRFVGRSRFANNSATHRDWYLKSCANSSLVVLGIFENASDCHIGNVSLKELDWHNRRGWLGYLIGEKEYHGKGIATEAVLMFTYYAFQRLNLHRVHTTVSCGNEASIRVLEKAGFREEGRFRQHIILGRELTDVLAFAALAPEWLQTHAAAARSCFADLQF